MKVVVFCKGCDSKLMLEESVAETIEKCPICGASFRSAATVQSADHAEHSHDCGSVDCSHVAPLVQETQVETAPVEDNNNPNDDFDIVFGRLRKYKGAGGNVVIPRGVFSIDAKAFFNCKTIQTLVIPEGVQKIGDKAFFGCDALVEVALPASVTSIGEAAFIGSKLQGISVDSRNKAYCSLDGDLYTKDKSVIVQACAGKTGASVMLPSGVRKIGPYAFFDCRNLQKIIMPETVREIGAHAFYNCLRLHDIDHSMALREIGDGAFAWCKKLCEFTVPESCHTIGEKAFEHCANLEHVFISSGVVQIGVGAFLECISLQKACFALRGGWFADGESIAQTMLSNDKKAAKLLRETFVGMTWTYGKDVSRKTRDNAGRENAFASDLRELLGKKL